jgi:hypothetical protein
VSEGGVERTQKYLPEERRKGIKRRKEEKREKTRDVTTKIEKIMWSRKF